MRDDGNDTSIGGRRAHRVREQLGPSAARDSDLDVTKVVAGSLAFLIAERGALLRVLALPLTVLLVLAAGAAPPAADAAGTPTEEAPFPLVVLVIALAAQTVFATTVHRVALLGASSVPRWGLRWGWRETLFVLHAVAIGCVLAPIALIAAGVGPAGLPIAAALAAWIVSRLSLVFPAIAMDERVSFSDAWVLSRGYQLELMLLVVAIPFVLIAPTLAFPQNATGRIGAQLIGALASIIALTSLSILYREIRRSPNKQ